MNRLLIPAPLVFVIFLFYSNSSCGQFVSEFRDWEEFTKGAIDQGKDGPCEYITQAWMIEANIRMHYKNASVDLSEYHSYQRCFIDLPRFDIVGCVSSSSALTDNCHADFIREIGLVSEACYSPKYIDGKPQYGNRDALKQKFGGDEDYRSRCINPCLDDNGTGHGDTGHRYNTHYDDYQFTSPLDYATDRSMLGIDTNEDLKKSIIKYGPHSLYFSSTPTGDSEHAILVMGWNSHDEWLILNSSSKHFDAIGFFETGELAFDINKYHMKVARSNGIPKCKGKACDQFNIRVPDEDGDGFCGIKWGDIPTSYSCKGHDADDTNPETGPYTDYGYETELISGSTVAFSYPRTKPTQIKATSKVLLKTGFKYNSAPGKSFKAVIGSTYH